ncbi:MAG: glucokinase [Gammaproteobacteria bacterium]|jgi:glucokinase|nr:glucokinase [Gammaproteobacteria bacterium]
MILAGDIGGTKTVLALWHKKEDIAGGMLHEIRYESGRYSSLEAIIEEYLRKTHAQPVAACFGVAGPVKNRRAETTNLPWFISADVIGGSFDIPDVYLLNDLESIATAVPHLEKDDVRTLNQGTPTPEGNMAVIAPGTGLGIAFLVWTGDRYLACPSEGGHASFSPRNLQQTELLTFLQRRYGHVSFERICSGSQLPNIYDFFKEQRSLAEPDWLREDLERATDRTPVIVQAALEQKSKLCEATLDMFVHVLGTVIGNMAVTLLPGGGIYLGGGIPPRILERLEQPDFLSAIADKGRFSSLVSGMPVHVILNPKAGLYGAAWYGLEALKRTGRG